MLEEYSYLGLGTGSYTTDGGGESGCSDAGRVLSTLTRERFQDASGTGTLGSPSSGIGTRVSYAGYYFDAGGRSIAMVNVGTNGGSSWTRPGSVPSRSDTVLVTSETYDDDGRVYEVTVVAVGPSWP